MAILKNTSINSTGALDLPSGTIAQRPGSPSKGYLRHNSTLNQLEYWNGTYWKYVPDIERNFLRLYYDAAEPSSYSGSGTTVNDINPTATKSNGTLTGGVTYSSSNGGIFTFDGVDDYIDSNTTLTSCGGLFADTQSWSVSAWFKPDTTNTSIAAIVGLGGGVGTSATFVIWTEGTALYARIRGGTVFTYPVTLSSTKWYNVCVVYNTAALYGALNGQYAGTINIGAAAQQTYNFTIGATAGGTLYPFKGSIANVCVYNEYLNFRRVRCQFDALKSRFGVIY
jgi:hypothetical protein